MVAILMMPANLATLGLLKKRYFERKVMTTWFLSMTSPTTFYHMTQIIYIVDVVMWPKFGNSSISMREVTITTIL